MCAGLQGWGVHCATAVPRGSALFTYAGERLSNREADERLRAYDAARLGHALLVCCPANVTANIQIRNGCSTECPQRWHPWQSLCVHDSLPALAGLPRLVPGCSSAAPGPRPGDAPAIHVGTAAALTRLLFTAAPPRAYGT